MEFDCFDYFNSFCLSDRLLYENGDHALAVGNPALAINHLSALAT